MADKKSTHFSLNMTHSEASSRSQSPILSSTYGSRETASELDGTPVQRGDVYDRVLPWWRAFIRRKLVESVERESKVIANMQAKIRTPFLDAFFVYTSSLGTHTFFMIILPAFFFFGYGKFGRGLLAVLAFGIYISSFVKDLICSPRPFAPPVTRLTIGSHHLEYGFPSTHSTNSVSIALFFYAIIHATSTNVSITLQDSSDVTQSTISPTSYLVLCSILVLYAFSIVFGRLYTGMHSFTDCVVGVLLGAGIWWVQTDWLGIPLVFSHSNLLYQFGRGLNVGAWADEWVRRGGWEIPLILIPLCLLAVHKHPQPVDDCPCFEDAIAILSAALGVYISHWAVNFSGALQRTRIVVMPGSGWVLEAGRWMQVERGWQDVLLWWTVAAVKMILGILIIFVWRILAKSALHMVLPPTFRLLSQFFRLPRRRFYTPATEYKSVPSEFHSDESGRFALRPIPSVIELPTAVGVRVEVGGIGSGVNGISDTNVVGSNNNSLKTRHAIAVSTEGDVQVKNQNLLVDKESRRKVKPVKHYDVDVLTKVIVYAGIAILSSDVIPLMFDLLGLGAKSWVEV